MVNVRDADEFSTRRRFLLIFLFNDDVRDAAIKEKKANEIFPVCLLRIAAMRRYVARRFVACYPFAVLRFRLKRFITKT